jgi:magnesium-protoporphyrin IX monomethyl ester (oxidative) cyclase
MRYKFLRVLLVKPKGRKGLGFAADVIPIGLEYLAASIEKEADYVQSATDHNEGLRLAKIAKDSGITTALGGYHPTAIPDELLSHPQVDIIVRGEGELTMKELLQKGTPDGILGISFKKDGKIIHNPDRPLIENLDSLPFPARHLRRYKYKDHMNNNGKYKYKDHMNNNGKELEVITMSRGCWGRCSFCCEPYMSNSHMRFRSPENIMKELFEIVSFHKGKPLQIFATDPHFMGDPKRIDDLCDLLQEHKLDMIFSVMTRVDSIVKHPELVKRMCDSGILSYELGFESPNQKDLNNVKKCITRDMQRNAVKILRDNGANVSGTFVIGLPGHDEEEIKQFSIYAKKIGLMNCAFGIVTPFPKTDFYEKLENDGLIFERDWTKYDEMHSVFKLNPLTPERLEELETYCTTRFWTINTLLDRAKVLQKRTGKKTSLKDFIYDMIVKAKFARNAGYDMINGEIEDYVKVVLDAIIEAEMEENGRKISMHDVIEMSRFLKILGPQVIQIALKCDNQIVSYVIKTTNKKVEFIKTISEKQNNATIDINIYFFIETSSKC